MTGNQNISFPLRLNGSSRGWLTHAVNGTWSRFLGLTASPPQQPAANAVQHESVQTQHLPCTSNHIMTMHRRPCILTNVQWHLFDCGCDCVFFPRVKVFLRKGASGKEKRFSSSVPWFRPSSCGIHYINTKVTPFLVDTFCLNTAASCRY